jgi:hypothetical protein
VEQRRRRRRRRRRRGRRETFFPSTVRLLKLGNGNIGFGTGQHQ